MSVFRRLRASFFGESQDALFECNINLYCITEFRSESKHQKIVKAALRIFVECCYKPQVYW